MRVLGGTYPSVETMCVMGEIICISRSNLQEISRQNSKGQIQGLKAKVVPQLALSFYVNYWGSTRLDLVLMVPSARRRGEGCNVADEAVSETGV